MNLNLKIELLNICGNDTSQFLVGVSENETKAMSVTNHNNPGQPNEPMRTQRTYRAVFQACM